MYFQCAAIPDARKPAEGSQKPVLERDDLGQRRAVQQHVVDDRQRREALRQRIRQLVVAGSLDPSDVTTLGKLKEKYGITEEESKALEHHLLASFGKLRVKGRILVADDDERRLDDDGDALLWLIGHDVPPWGWSSAP